METNTPLVIYCADIWSHISIPRLEVIWRPESAPALNTVHAVTSIFTVHFCFFFFSGEFKIFSLLFITGMAAARPTVLVDYTEGLKAALRSSVNLDIKN